MDIVHKVGIKAPIPAVYRALSTIPGLAGWWTSDTTGASTVGGRIRFWFKNPGGDERGGFDMEVLALEPDRFVRWRVVDGPADCIGADIDFTLVQAGDTPMCCSAIATGARRANSCLIAARNGRASRSACANGSKPARGGRRPMTQGWTTGTESARSRGKTAARGHTDRAVSARV